MNKTDFVSLVAKNNNISKTEAGGVVDMFIEGVKDALKQGEGLQLVGFGNWKVTHKPAHDGRNPQTGATIKIKASNRVTFSAGQALKDSVN